MRDSTDSLLAFARQIDASAVESALSDFGGIEGAELAVLLAAAFPWLTPRVDWQFEAIASLSRTGFRARRTRSELVERLLGAAGPLDDPQAVRRGLRRATWAEKVRIALRELLPLRMGGAEVRVTARELSELADATFEVALAEAAFHVSGRYGPPKRNDGELSTFFVLGMGKLGGFELNAGSDVDVIFMYDTDEGESDLSLHEHWTKVARRLVATIEDSTPDGNVWRVDLRLRPEGSRGPLVNSVAAAERYYVTWGRLWERSAMLRGRPIAGDLELGDRVRKQVIQPFVYRRDAEPEIATSMAEMVERSRIELSTNPERDLKLGNGGIREAEFFVQSLQLIWGGRVPSLRVTGTLMGLSRLRAEGLVTDLEASHIAGGYLFLRRVEHRIQWMTGLQTHLLPKDEANLNRLARSMGYEDGVSLVEALAHARGRIRALFDSIMPAAPRPPSRHQVLLAALITDDSPVIERSVSEEFGKADIGEHLAALARRPDGLLGDLTQERHPDLADGLLDAIREASDPELAAQQIRSFFARFTSYEPYVSVLAKDPRALQRFVTVLGASAFVGDAISSRPDLADVILFPVGSTVVPEEVVAVELARAFQGAPHEMDAHERRERFLDGTRRAKSRAMVEVAVLDLAGGLRIRETTRLLSRLADEIVDQAVRFALHGKSTGLAVIAVGKLGGRDIGYGSDLDVLFVFDPEAAPPEEDAAHYFSKAAQRVIRLLSEPHPAGPGYELDTRLRPSGSAGMLVTSLESFARYHGLGQIAGRPSVMSSGEAWERQALLRARYCAGDRVLGQKLVEIAQKAAYEGGPPLAQNLNHIRMRMERELAHERPGRYDLKIGSGGLLDIEFATQWLQMSHGNDSRIRTTDIGEALDSLSAAGYVTRRDYEVLRDGYRFLRRLEQRIHVLRGRSDSILDESQPGLPQLARRMSFQSSPQRAPERALMDRYQEVTRSVREAYRRVLGLDLLEP